MRSDFATARRYLEQAQDCLRGDDNLTEKMLAALGLLIDAALTAEYTRSRTAEVVPFPPAGAGRASWKVKKTFGNRGESPQS
jgi:hypothetical protein